MRGCACASPPPKVSSLNPSTNARSDAKSYHSSLKALPLFAWHPILMVRVVMTAPPRHLMRDSPHSTNANRNRMHTRTHMTERGLAAPGPDELGDHHGAQVRAEEGQTVRHCMHAGLHGGD